MLFVARRTAVPTPGETCGRWAKIEETQTNVANRNRERCFIAEISALNCLLGSGSEPDCPNIGPDSRRRTSSMQHSVFGADPDRHAARSNPDFPASDLNFPGSYPIFVESHPIF